MTDNTTYVMLGLIISLGSSILLLKVASKHYKNRKKCQEKRYLSENNEINNKNNYIQYIFTIYQQ